MVAGPSVTPQTLPDDEPTVATAGLMLDHVPPEGGQLNVLHVPGHTFTEPVIGPTEGSGFTVTTAVRVQ